jgi:hypothetical protein
MGILGWGCMIFWGLEYLPGLTSFLICLSIAFFFVVLVIDQFGLVPKGAKRK